MLHQVGVVNLTHLSPRLTVLAGHYGHFPGWFSLSPPLFFCCALLLYGCISSHDRCSSVERSAICRCHGGVHLLGSIWKGGVSNVGAPPRPAHRRAHFSRATVSMQAAAQLKIGDRQSSQATGPLQLLQTPEQVQHTDKHNRKQDKLNTMQQTRGTVNNL